MNLKIGEFKLFILRSRKKKRMKKNEPSLRDLWDPIQPNKIYITNHRRKGERKEQKEYLRNNSGKPLKFYKSHKSLHSKRSTNSKNNKCKENHTETYYKHIIKRQRPKSKNLKAAREKQSINIRDLQKIESWFLSRNHKGQKVIWWYTSSIKKKKKIQLSTKNSMSG